MSFLKNLFGASPKQRTMLDDVQEVSGRLIVKGYRRIAAQHGCAPTAKTTDMTPEQIAEGQKLASEFVPTVFGSWGIKPLISHKK